MENIVFLTYYNNLTNKTKQKIKFLKFLINLNMCDYVLLILCILLT